MDSRIPSAASSAGLEQIDGAKRRLAAARCRESSTALALESAERRWREHAEDARVHLRSAREDVEEAEAHLRMVERRRETIEAGEATAQRATIEATDDAEEGDGEGNGSPARKRRKSRRETEREADRVEEEGGGTKRIVSPAARRTSPSDESSSFVFHRHAPPGPLGLSFFVGLRERNALVVRCVSDDSPLSGYVRKHDVVIKFDGVNTEDMDIDAFRELVLARSSNGDGVRKVTLRRFVDRRNLKLFLRSDGNQSH